MSMNELPTSEEQNVSRSVQEPDERESTGKAQSRLPDVIQRILPHVPLFLCAVAMLLALSLCIYFMIGPAEGYFHSDCTDTLLWAQASFDSGKVFNPDFNYAALLPFGASVWLIPLIAIFGVTMKTHVIGMIIFALLFALSIVLLCRKLGWSYSWSFGATALIFMLLSSSDKLREIMWNHVIYYSLGLLLLFFLLTLTFHAQEKLALAATERSRIPLRLLPLAGLLIFTVLNATNGFQMLVLTVLPVFVGVFLERLFDRKTAVFSRENLPTVTVLGILLLGTLVGSALLKERLGDISSGYANAYSSYSNPDDWFDNFDKFFMNWFTLIGLDIRNGDPLASLDSIVNILRLGVAILLLLIPVVFLFFYQKISNRQTQVLVIAHAFLLAFLFFGCVCGRLAAANWRLTPLLGSSVLVTVSAAHELWIQRKSAVASCRAGVLVLAVLALLSGWNGKIIADMPFDYGRDNDLHLLADALEDQGLEYGYATFWRSQAITLLTDSRVKVREILVEKDEIITDMYQSQGVWYEQQEGVTEYFILLSESEYQKIAYTPYWKQITSHCMTRMVYVSGYHIIVFAENIWNDHSTPPLVTTSDSGSIS